MRRMSVMTAVLGLVLLTACGGGAATTPTGSAPPPSTARPATAVPVATPAPTAAPVPTVAAIEEPTPQPVETQGAGGSPSALDLCSLVSTTRVSAVLKQNVLDGAAEAGTCTWAPSDATGTTLLIIEQDTVDDFNSIRTITGGYEVTTLIGLGDDAYVSVATGTNVATLYLRKGDNFIQIGVVDQSWSVADVTGAEKTIAAEAVSGL